MNSNKRRGYVSPNLSEHINPKDCEKCGAACCKQFSFGYRKDAPPLSLSILHRFKLLFEDMVDVVEGEDNVVIIFKKPCPQLDENNKCKIYYDREQRPLLCRMYPYENTVDCPYMKKEEEE